MLPFFLKFAANPNELDWVYDLRVDWEEQVGTEKVPVLVAG
jgi:hypothetical protein